MNTDPTSVIPIPDTAERNDRLEKVRAYAHAHPDEFDMDYWVHISSCGTTRCIAGTAVFLFAPEARLQSMFEGSQPDLVKLTPESEPELIEYVARDLLGLTDDQANTLFYSESQWEEVLDDIIEGLMEDD